METAKESRQIAKKKQIKKTRKQRNRKNKNILQHK